MILVDLFRSSSSLLRAILTLHPPCVAHPCLAAFLLCTIHVLCHPCFTVAMCRSIRGLHQSCFASLVRCTILVLHHSCSLCHPCLYLHPWFVPFYVAPCLFSPALLSSILAFHPLLLYHLSTVEHFLQDLYRMSVFYSTRRCFVPFFGSILLRFLSTVMVRAFSVVRYSPSAWNGLLRILPYCGRARGHKDKGP